MCICWFIVYAQNIPQCMDMEHIKYTRTNAEFFNAEAGFAKLYTL